MQRRKALRLLSATRRLKLPASSRMLLWGWLRGRHDHSRLCARRAEMRDLADRFEFEPPEWAST